VTRPVFQSTSSYLFLDLAIVRLTVLRIGEKDACPHPKGHRWGLWTEEGETCAYFGGLLATFTPLKVIRMEAAAASRGGPLAGVHSGEAPTARAVAGVGLQINP
jgi:hypothetical protein